MGLVTHTKITIKERQVVERTHGGHQGSLGLFKCSRLLFSSIAPQYVDGWLLWRYCDVIKDKLGDVWEGFLSKYGKWERGHWIRKRGIYMGHQKSGLTPRFGQVARDRRFQMAARPPNGNRRIMFCISGLIRRLDRGRRMLIFMSGVKRRFTSAARPQNVTAEICWFSRAWFCGLFGGFFMAAELHLTPRAWNGGFNLRPGRRNEPPIAASLAQWPFRPYMCAIHRL